MDPYMITPVERSRHMDQFAPLAPPGGMITGAQAKTYFMQSGLPPMVLAQIWGLADMNADGQMDLNEFSVACKLITMKLQGYEIPGNLPPSMIAAAQPSVPSYGAPQPHMSGMMPVYSMASSMGMPHSTGAPMATHYTTSMGGMPGHMHGASMASAYSSPVNTVTPALSHAPVPVVLPVSSAASVGTPGSTAGGAWNIAEGTRSKYSNIFFQMDKSRVGFLGGIQARNTLLQTGLPQNVLAQIWTLSDIDGNGKLSCDEFIVSGYLCDLATKGEPLPGKLPSDIIPPSFRPFPAPGPQIVSTAGSTVSTPGSSRAESVVSPSTFEDKRRENFNKGQAELEKRRQSIVDQQKREADERKKKEAAEAVEKEKQRQELERQRIMEWEDNRKKELNSHRQNEQEKLLQLKAKQTNIKDDMDKSRDRIKHITEEIANCRTGVADVKSFIDTMRSSRDEKMNKMNALKQQLKDQNERLLKVTQEKAQMESKKAALASQTNGEQITEFEFRRNEKKKKVEQTQKLLEEMKEKFETIKGEKEAKRESLDGHKESLIQIIEACKTLYDSFDEKRREIKAEKSKRMRELTDPDHAWGNEEPEPVSAGGDSSDAVEAYALYDFEPSNEDELAFKTGDKIIVHKNLDPEPGWLGGEFNGKAGWFPETFVTYDPSALEAIAAEEVETDIVAKVIVDWTGEDSFSMVKGAEIIVIGRPTEEWCFGKVKDTEACGFFPSVILSVNPDEEEVNTDELVLPTDSLPTEVFVAHVPYQSTEPGDLVFEEGQKIRVLVKNSEWWTGQYDDKLGVFPSNYVVPEGEAGAPNAEAPPPGESQVEASAPVESEDAANPPPANPDESNAPRIKPKKVKKDDKTMELAKVVAPYEATSTEQLSLTRGQMIIIRKKADSGWWQGEVQGGKGKKRQIGWFPASYVKLLEAKEGVGPAKDLGNVEALFDYEGARSDELSFKQGDIIELLSKEDGDWWRGKLETESGMFPCNYVKEV